MLLTQKASTNELLTTWLHEFPIPSLKHHLTNEIVLAKKKKSFGLVKGFVKTQNWDFVKISIEHLKIRISKNEKQNPLFTDHTSS